jgi:hypothetical protein
MDVKVLSKLGQALSRHLSGSSLAGDSMLVRLRSGTIGLLGLVAAVGLGLIAMIAQQGLPGVASGPLPQRPPAPFVHHQTIALPRLAASNPAKHRARSRRSSSASRQAPVPAVPTESEIAGSRQVAEATDHSSPVAHTPTSHPGTGGQPPQPDNGIPPTTTVAASPPPAQPAAESSGVPAAAQPEDESPGHSGEHHGHSPHWAGHNQSHGHESSSRHQEPPSYEPPAAESPADDQSDSEADSGDDGHGPGRHGRSGWTGH